MISIVKGETKSWYVTLAEKVTIANPYYLFSFTHSQTETITNVILTDSSTFPERYNKFIVTEGVTFTLYSGQYKYVAYAQESSTNTNPTLADEIVEVGILEVDMDIQPEVFYNPE